MPEGHTIHRLAKDLRGSLSGTAIQASSPQGRFADGAAAIDGADLTRADAYGKHLFLSFAPDELLHIHLGLIGKLRRRDATEEPVGAIRLRLAGNGDAWDLSGPQTCALINPDDRDRVVAALGPDPLRRGANFDVFADRLSRRSIPVGAALLEQKIVAGIGNVFRSEFLFLCGILPSTPANTLDADVVRALWDTAQSQLRLGMRLNRIVTRDPLEVGTTAGRIGDEDRLYVYRRGGLPCHRCGTEIRISEIAGRSIWHCSTCQS